MKRFILSCVALMLVGQLFAGEDINEVTTKWVTVISSSSLYGANHSTATPVDITSYKAFGYYLDVNNDAGGTCDVAISYQICDYMGAGDGAYVGIDTLSVLTTTNTITNWITPATGGTLDASVAADQADAFAPMATKWLKMVVTGNPGNGSDTWITLKIVLYGEK